MTIDTGIARPTRDDYFMAFATLVSSRGTCPRRRVGCVLVDAAGRVLATGYNGAPIGAPHCIDVPCPGAHMESGAGLDLCEAIHAEQNALMFCADVSRVSACYLTTSPCPSCVKLLLNTGCNRIVYRDGYPGPGLDWWHRAGRKSERVICKMER